tara:strand:+ start:373 stop:849 length:477 start_codon:yes stop_codon:yes gene_type:complete
MKPEDIGNADTIIAMNRSGATNVEIGAALGLTRKQVGIRRKALGLVRPGSAYAKLVWCDKMENMWTSGVSRDEMAKVFTCHKTSISRLANRLGKNPRRLSGAKRRTSKKASKPGLTPEQARDVATLRNFGDTLEVAFGKVTAPKVKIRATPKQDEARA